MKTKKSKTLRLSEMQIAVLLEGVDHKLSRSSMGWSFDDGTRPLPIFYAATIRSLWKRGLLDSNFTDPRGVGTGLEARWVQNFDGVRAPHSPEVHELMVWTSALGRKVLEDIGRIVVEDFGSQVLEDSGLLPDRSQIVYH